MTWRERLAKLVAGERGVIAYDAIPQLQQVHADLVRRARQLRQHAQQAPNELNRMELTRLADEDDAHGQPIVAALATMGGATIEPPQPSATSAVNHWARLVNDLEAHRSALRRLREEVIHFAESVPDTAALFDRLYGEEEKHAAVLRDLIARTDPQALN